MLNARNLCLQAMVICCTSLFSIRGHADNNGYTSLVKRIYPAHSITIPMRPHDYQALYRSYADYLGNNFEVYDPACVGGVVTLFNEVDTMFTVTAPSAARSIDKNIFFMWGNMLHGGMCQAGLVFSRNMQVKLVATYITGRVGDAAKATIPNLLTVYVRNPGNLKYLPTLQHWASGETQLFYSPPPNEISPKTYRTRVYNLHCETKEKRIDVPECRMHPAGLQLP